MGYSSYIIPLTEERETDILHSLLPPAEKGGILFLSDPSVLNHYREVSRAWGFGQLYITDRWDGRKIFRRINRDHTLLGAEPACIIDQIRRGQIDLSRFRTMAARIPDGEGISFLDDLSYILGHMVDLERVYIMTPGQEQPLRHPLLEGAVRDPRSIAKKKEKNMARIPENMLAAIDELVKKTKSDNEPEKLQEYRRLLKKSIPLGYRSWVAAYLLKEYLSRDKSLKMPLLEESATLFIGIGKNRKVYPKDLIHLFINTGKIERSHIGEIRILDNYAFVSIEKKSADLAIENLNGINYRGRNLTVNYAKQK